MNQFTEKKKKNFRGEEGREGEKGVTFGVNCSKRVLAGPLLLGLGAFSVYRESA
jgi:hypothetical protein